MIAVDFWIDRDSEPVGKYSPGDVIPDDHPKRAWLLKSGIARVDSPEHVKSEPVKVEPKVEVKPEPKKVEVALTPKPTDSIDAWRSYLKDQGIESKGLSKPQMIKAISNLNT